MSSKQQNNSARLKLAKALVIGSSPMRASNQKKKNKKKQRNPRKPLLMAAIRAGGGRVAIKGHPILGGMGITSNTGSLPAAFVNLLGNTTFISPPTGVTHPDLGIEGTQIHGCQPLTNILTAAADSSLFVNASLATAAANSVNLIPDSLNGPVAAQANFYNNYVFRDVLIEYISNVATSQAGSCCLSFTTDGALNTPASFAEARQNIPSITFPFRADRAYLHYHYDGPTLHFCEIDAATLAGQRSTVQAIINGWPSATSIGAVTQGFTNIYYVLEMYNPLQSQGITMVWCNPEEKVLLKSYLAKLRGDPSSSSTSSGFEMVSNRFLTPQIPLRK